jgi:hypothetical protein
MKDKAANITLISVIAMLFLLVSSLTAILLDDGGQSYSLITLRGEQIEIYGGNGLYQFDNTYKAIAFRSFDWANVVVVFPLFVIALILYRRTKFRGQLLLLALFTYLAYIYLIGVMGNAFNAMFLVWTALFSIGVFGLCLILNQMDLKTLPEKLVGPFPRKSIAIYMVVVGLILIAQYLFEVIAAYMTNTPPASLDHYTTLELAALELGLMIPLKILGGLALWRKKLWGYIVSTVLVFTTSIVFVALSVSLLLFHVTYGSGDFLDMAITIGITIVASIFSIAIFKRVGD